MALPMSEGAERIYDAYSLPHIFIPEYSDVEWQRNSLCNDKKGTLVGLFFSLDIDDIESAKSICSGCPVRVECMQFADVHPPTDGVWAGELYKFGKKVQTIRKPGRPKSQ